MEDQGTPLTGGRVTPGVVKVGDTVRRPTGNHSEYAHALLEELEREGFDAAPRFLGLDEGRREILTYLPGEVPDDLRLFTDEQAAAAARLLRRYHDATVRSPLRGTGEVVCHGDVSPCNHVFRNGLPYALIDFDGAHPGCRREDVGYGAWLWFDIGNAAFDARTQGKRLAGYVAAYGNFDPNGAVRAVLDAQETLSRNRDLPLATRAWAWRARDWTARHIDMLTNGIGDYTW